VFSVSFYACLSVAYFCVECIYEIYYTVCAKRPTLKHYNFLPFEEGTYYKHVLKAKFSSEYEIIHFV